MEKQDSRIYFKDNPYPNGHAIKDFVWSGRLDPNSELWFDFHLETEKYYQEDDSEDTTEAESDWKAKSVWDNYHQCTMSSTHWPSNNGGILVGTKEAQFDLNNLTQQALLADTLPLADDYDPETLSFFIYLLGHDSCANHCIKFSKQEHLFGVEWTGKLALTYGGEYDFNYDFAANINAVKFDGIAIVAELDTEANWKLLGECVKNSEEYELIDGKFQFRVG